MIGNINTDGTFDGNETRIVDITSFVEKAKQNTAPVDANELNNIKNSAMRPIV